MNGAVDRHFERRLSALIHCGEPAVLAGGRKGLEKESLRVTPRGRIATTPHPRALGAALTSEFITTDYSEALIELVTPAFTESWALLQFLCDLHQFTYRHLGDELLWATSMPCELDGDASIPIAYYGTSNVGTMKTVYRRGLGWRYGRMMQAIAGVHFNYSFPATLWPVLADLRQERDHGRDFVSARYFDLLRNYRRFGWLILYLFGASPAVAPSFVAGRAHALSQKIDGTLYAPYATSLRMSDLGYRNKSQRGVQVSANSLPEYIADLTRAITTVHPEYERIGVRVDGEYRQLNANLLQIENEYYSFIRPKRVALPGERPTLALERGGVEYVELRAVDVSAFDPVGISENSMRFLEAFLALCLLKDSPPVEATECAALDANHALVAYRGREPGLTLIRGHGSVPLAQWARELLEAMQGICELLDRGSESRPYSTALELQARKVEDSTKTPSAQLMFELEMRCQSFAEFALEASRRHKEYFLGLYPSNEQRLAQFLSDAEGSLRRQAELEAAPAPTFDEYLAEYFSN
jgi:glutamate--cysteine ligase